VTVVAVVPFVDVAVVVVDEVELVSVFPDSVFFAISTLASCVACRALSAAFFGGGFRFRRRRDDFVGVLTGLLDFARDEKCEQR